MIRMIEVGPSIQLPNDERKVVCDRCLSTIGYSPSNIGRHVVGYGRAGVVYAYNSIKCPGCGYNIKPL